MPVILIATVIIIGLIAYAIWDWYNKQKAVTQQSKESATAMVTGYATRDEEDKYDLRIMMADVSDNEFVCSTHGISKEEYPLGTMVDVKYYQFPDGTVKASLLRKHDMMQ